MATSYIVLRQTERSTWEIVDQQAGTAEQAIRKTVGKRGEDGTTLTPDGTYVAVPARSWKPVTVKAEVSTTIRLGEWGGVGTAPIDVGSD